MTKTNFLDEIKTVFEVSKSSNLFVVLIILLIVTGYLLISLKKENKDRGKIIYTFVIVFITIFTIATYYKSLSEMFDYMMNNFFIVALFPNLAVYLAAIIITNIIVWKSVFNKKEQKIIKTINVIVFCILNYLLAITLYIINTSHLDVFKQKSIYENIKAKSIIELSSSIFITWIVFLLLYSFYYRKTEKARRKMILRRRAMLRERQKTYNKITPPRIAVSNMNLKSYDSQKEKKIEKESLELDNYLTKEDYKLLLEMLKEQKEKKRLEIITKASQQEEQERYIALQELYNIQEPKLR